MATRSEERIRSPRNDRNPQRRSETEGRPVRHGGSHRNRTPHEPVARKPDAAIEEVEGELVPARGVLELHPQGYGFLRNETSDYRPAKTDVFVPAIEVQSRQLRPGNLIEGTARQVRKQEGPRLEELHRIDGYLPGQYPHKEFEQLTPILPQS